MTNQVASTFQARVIAGAVVCALAGGCHVTAQKAPQGLLGVTWGDDAAEAARKIGLVCDRWDPWTDSAFETSIDLQHPRSVLGVEGVVRIVRVSGTQLDGVQVTYRNCASNDGQKQQLRTGLRNELHLQSPDVDVPYETWADHSLVHFITDPRDGTCTLTVAGPRWGKAFAAALLSDGVRNVGTAMTPH
jgi:hypothetical protein